MLRHRYVYDENAVEHFQREVALLQRLRHPSIIAVRECFVAFNTRFLAMDYCDGDDLARRLHCRGALSEEIVRAMLGQIASGLQYAHEQGVIHMDLKPSNILIYRDGQLAIADFGLSRMLGSERTWKIVRGTPAYMPPEQLAGMPVGFSGDWYAVGCLAFELLTGRKLFAARDLVDLCLNKSTSHPDSSWPELEASEELRGVLVEMLRVDQEERRFDYKAIAAWSRPVPEIFAAASKS